MTNRLALLCEKISEAIGGRSRALAFEKATSRRFKRQTLQNWIDGLTYPDVAELQALADEVKRPLSWFLGIDERDPDAPSSARELQDAVAVPILDVQAAAGAGAVADVVRAEAEFTFPTYFLRKLLGDRASSARLSSLRARGESMEPTIADGALLIIDETQREMPAKAKLAKMRRTEPEIFVFFTSDGLRLKRLSALEEGLIAIISDNIRRYPIELFKPGRDGKLTIIGKVIWWDNRL